jgi:hypothetical protein
MHIPKPKPKVRKYPAFGFLPNLEELFAKITMKGEFHDSQPLFQTQF